jgi:hypothetical protein
MMTALGSKYQKTIAEVKVTEQGVHMSRTREGNWAMKCREHRATIISCLIVSIVLAAGTAYANDFAARAKAGKQALATPEGKKYEDSWGEVMGGILQTCIPLGSTDPGNLGRFTFVADVSSSGSVSSVEVQPVTRVSRCFAEQFGKANLPRPPMPLKKGELLPVADDIVVTP